MSCIGDSERQAFLRNQRIKKQTTRNGEYTSRILDHLKLHMKLLDMGCGTGHIIQELAFTHESSIYVGLDVSFHMLKVARKNSRGIPNILLVQGDGCELPFSNNVFDVVITRLAKYSPKEAYRVLRRGGSFLVYGLGSEASKEILEFLLKGLKSIISSSHETSIHGSMKSVKAL